MAGGVLFDLMVASLSVGEAIETGSVQPLLGWELLFLLALGALLFVLGLVMRCKGSRMFSPPPIVK